jgi:hypothetical protein
MHFQVLWCAEKQPPRQECIGMNKAFTCIGRGDWDVERVATGGWCVWRVSVGARKLQKRARSDVLKRMRHSSSRGVIFCHAH